MSAPEGGTSILVVEDDHDIAALVAESLEMEGYSVRTARNGRVGLELLRAWRPSAVVLDMMMPEVDGFGFLAGYREEPEPRPPVLAVSAFDAYLQLARDHGAAATLAKPFELDSLLAVIEALASRRTAPAPEVPAPLDEDARLSAILELRLDQPAPTAAIEEFVQRVARIFDVPICLLSIVTQDRQSWHAACGLSDELRAAGGSPRGDSFCTHAVVARAALVVTDACENPLFVDNPFVRDRGVRFYAGVPVADRLGSVVGTLCLLDGRPRDFTRFDLELLSILARRVAAELEWRERRLRPDTPPSAFRHLAWVDEELDVLGREAFEQALQIQSLRAGEQRRPLSLAVYVTDPAALPGATAALKAELDGALLARLGHARVGVLAVGVTAAELRERMARAAPGARLVVRDVPRLVGAVDGFLHDAEAEAGAREVR